MTIGYCNSRTLAISAGIAATGGALAILLCEPVTTGAWRLDHGLLPVIVAITIMAGHLVGSALRDRKVLWALGFALVFSVGTMLTVYASVGTQSEKSGDKAYGVEAHNKAVADKRADLAKEKRDLALAKGMLGNVQSQHLAEGNAGGCKAKCQGLERSITVYAASITGHETMIRKLEIELQALGGERTARPKAEAFATAAAVFGFERQRVETAATVLEPFAYSLLLELAAIVAFGYAFGNRRSPIPVPPVSATAASATVAETALAAPAVVAAPTAPTPPAAPTPSRGGNRCRRLREKRVATRAAAEADVIHLVARGERLPSQHVLAQRWGVNKGTVSKWLSNFEQRSRVVRTVAGRTKQVAAAPLRVAA